VITALGATLDAAAIQDLLLGLPPTPESVGLVGSVQEGDAIVASPCVWQPPAPEEARPTASALDADLKVAE
jgi:hypothetical protein